MGFGFGRRGRAETRGMLGKDIQLVEMLVSWSGTTCIEMPLKRLMTAFLALLTGTGVSMMRTNVCSLRSRTGRWLDID